MNSTHATVGIGATSSMAALTTLLSGFHGLDGEHAAAAAWLIVTGAGACYALAAWFVAWKWPTAPALPGELVEIPQGAPSQVPQAQPLVQ